MVTWTASSISPKVVESLAITLPMIPADFVRSQSPIALLTASSNEPASERDALTWGREPPRL